jgi:predicted PurR-regulated permease PerM
MNRVITTLFVATSILLIAGAISFASAEDNFTQADRERLVRMEATQTVFMQQVDKRFDELRSDMNARFEQVDKRFEQVDKRFEQMTNMFYTLSAIFTSLFVAVFGFAWWDRRTMLTSAKKAAREEVNMSTADIREEMVILKQFFEVMKKYAEKTPDLKELMSRAHLL